MSLSGFDNICSDQSLVCKICEILSLTLTPFNVCFMIDYISKDKHVGAMDINSLKLTC